MIITLTFLVELIKLFLLIFGILGWDKKNSVIKITIMACIVLNVINIISSWVLHLSFDDEIVEIIGLLVIVIMTYGIGKIKNFPIVFLLYLMLSLIDMILAGLVAVAFHISIASIMDNNILTFLLNSLSIFFLLIIFIWFRIKDKQMNTFIYKVTRSEWILIMLGIVGIGFFIAPVQLLFIGESAQFNDTLMVIGASISGLVMLVIAIILIIKNNNIETYQKLHEMNESILIQQQNYYENLLEKEKRTRKLQHDIKEHFQCIGHLLNERRIEEAISYIEELNIDIVEVNNTISTGSHILNIVLADLKVKYETDKVEIKWQGKISPNIKLSNRNVCGIFYNLFKNSYEAVQKISVSERVIYAKVGRFGSTGFYIEVSNPVMQKDIIKNGIIPTTKNDKTNHGFGLQIINDIVKKHGGTIKRYYENNIFKTEISFWNMIENSEN